MQRRAATFWKDGRAWEFSLLTSFSCLSSVSILFPPPTYLLLRGHFLGSLWCPVLQTANPVPCLHFPCSQPLGFLF